MACCSKLVGKLWCSRAAPGRVTPTSPGTRGRGCSGVTLAQGGGSSSNSCALRHAGGCRGRAGKATRALASVEVGKTRTKPVVGRAGLTG